MHASQRCCDLWGFCACKDGGQRTGELASWPKSFAVHQAEPGPDVVVPSTCVVHQLFFPPSPGTISHFFSLPMCGPPALKTATGLPGHQAPRSTGSAHRGCPFHVLTGEHPPPTLLVTKAWEPLCLGPAPLSLCSLFSRVKEAVDLRVMRC